MNHVARPTVLLRHDLPDRSHHFDWLLDLAASTDAPLTTFRLQQPVHAKQQRTRLAAEKIADHRRRYLDYEGPLSGNRGTVRRIAAGHIISAVSTSDQWLLTVHWTAPQPIVQQLQLDRHAETDADSSQWTVFCISQTQPNP